MSGEPVVEVRDAFVAYPGSAGPVMALRGADLSLDYGERLLVQGPNGSGKSTLLRVVTGEQPVAAGSVRVAGTDLTAMSAAERRRWRARAVGVVDQHAHRSLLPELSVVDNVGLQLWTTGSPRRRARARAEELLADLGLAELVGRPVAELSGGEAQRVSICAAVAHGPRLVLADEPTGALDAAGARAVHDLLTAIATTGTGVVLVSHDPATIAFADRAVRIRHGRTSEQWYPGSAAEEQLPDSRGWVRVPAELLTAGSPSGYVAETRGTDLLLRPVAGATPTEAAAETPRPRRPVGVPPERDVLVLSEVGVRYGERTLFAGLDLTLGAGDWAVVDGPSGSGKSTLLALVAGLSDPTSGAVRVGGTSWGERDRSARAGLRRRWVGYAPQRGSLLETLTVGENLQVSAAVRGRTVDRPRLDALAETLGLGTLLNRRAADLSGGEWQRASLARCLLADAPLLVLDEPTSQQDDASAAAVLAAVLDELAAGRTLLVASHDPRFVARAPRTVMLGRTTRARAAAVAD